MTEEKQLSIALHLSKAKRNNNNGNLRLHDSLEFYKEQILSKSKDTSTISENFSENLSNSSMDEKKESMIAESESEEEDSGSREGSSDDESGEDDEYEIVDGSVNFDDDIVFDDDVDIETSTGRRFDSDDDILFTDDVEFEDEIQVESEEEEEEECYVDKPFWFGDEGSDQIKFILYKYALAIKLDEDIKKCIRAPPPFIGRVKRAVIKDSDSFLTLDEVEVYRRSLLPPASVMPFVKKMTLLTTWSIEDGIPTEFRILNKKSDIREWNELKDQDEDSISFLFSFPNYGSLDYDYSQSRDSRDVTHSPHSTQDLSCYYGKYIPKQFCHQPSDDDTIG